MLFEKGLDVLLFIIILSGFQACFMIVGSFDLVVTINMLLKTNFIFNIVCFHY